MCFCEFSFIIADNNFVLQPRIIVTFPLEDNGKDEKLIGKPDPFLAGRLLL